MKKLLIIAVTLLFVGCTKDDILGPDFENFEIKENVLKSLNISNFNYPVNWTTHTQGKQEPYYFNGDNIPDIISYDESQSTTNSPKFFILDYTGKPLFEFDIYKYNPTIRDSLRTINYSFKDLNKDGWQDFILCYTGEYNNQGFNDAYFVGSNLYLLLSKGELDYEVIELYDDENLPNHGNVIADIDNDGFDDLIPFGMRKGDVGVYYKNINNSRFEQREIISNYTSEAVHYFDWDRDGKLDFINIGPHNGQITIFTTKQIIELPFKNTGWEFYFTVHEYSEEWSVERWSIIDADMDGYWDLVGSGFYFKNGKKYYEHKFFKNNQNTSFNYIPDYIENDFDLNSELQLWVDDINGDGYMDLYYPTYTNNILEKNNIFWLENTKNGFKINKKYKVIY